MSNLPNPGGWNWITGQIVDLRTGVPTAAFQRWLALTLAKIVSPNGAIASGAQIDGQSGSLSGNIGTL